MTPDNKSSHILNTSANLLGFCLVVMTSIKISNFNTSTSIDEVTAVASIFLMASCLLSFLAMRSRNQARADRLEYIADIVFLVSLLFLSGTIILVSLNFFF